MACKCNPPCIYHNVNLTHVYSFQIVTGLILSPTVNEFNYNGPFLKLGQNIGLLVGAAFWGVGADIWGRKFVHFVLFSKIDNNPCFLTKIKTTEYLSTLLY